MCGRYLLTSAPEAVRALLEYSETPNMPPRYNIAPAQPIAIVHMVGGQRRFALARWGLLPSWVKDPDEFPVLINARAETATTKPAFRGAMRHRRCLIPSDGFYEWQRKGRAKQPYLVCRADGAPMIFAGVWETWIGPDGEQIDTAAILTVAANECLAPIHDRMPAVLEAQDWQAWLDTDAVDARQAAELLRPAADDAVTVHPVSTRVNRVANDDAGLIEDVSLQAPLRDTPETAPRRRHTAKPGKPDQLDLF